MFAFMVARIAFFVKCEDLRIGGPGLLSMDFGMGGATAFRSLS
jgi:hypothetical protein